MKRLIIMVFLVFNIVTLAQNPEGLITCKVQNMPFSEFCNVIYQQSKIRIYYRPQWVAKTVVTLNVENVTAEQALEQVLRGTNLQVSTWNKDIVILPGKKLLNDLPVYSKGDNTETDDSAAINITYSEEKYLSGRRGDVPLILYIGQKGSAASSGKVKVTGRILDEETGEPIYTATIYIIETKSGAVSDFNGYLSFTLKPGSYNVLFEYLGYEKKKCQMELYSDGNFTITLHKSVIQMSEVVVYGDRQMNIRAKDPGLDKISIKTIRELPMMMGERDILKVSVTLPGIMSVGEGSSGINVRGGGADQNAFYINKVPIYNTSHLFGFFPAFNADIIKDFSIYKGHIPAQYGGHLSSVFNIETRQGNRKNITARGGISPVTANMVVEGPIVKDVGSYMFSARASYSDWILKKINNAEISNSTAAFNDFSGALNYDFKKSFVSVFAYHSYDRFNLSDLNFYEYSNNGASASYSYMFSNSLKAEFSVIASQYDFSTIDQQEISNSYQHKYKLEHYEFKSDFKSILNEKNILEYGIGAILYKLDRGVVEPYGELSFHKTTDLGNNQGVESAVYITEVCDLFPWLNITTGLRYAIFTPTGPQTVYLYQENKPMEPENIYDSVQYANNQPICWYHEPDLRIALNFKTDPSGAVKVAYNKMHQNLFLLNTTAAIAPNTQWKLADNHLLPSESSQWSAGVFRTFAQQNLETSAEIFFKKTKNFTEFKDGADFLNNPLVETAVLQGNQRAWGIELFLKRSLRKLDGWISYTYSRSLIQVDNEDSWNQINDGEEYPANYDIPHALNLVANYHISRRIILASIFTYQSGKPVTYPVSVYYVNGLPVIDYSKRNAYRIPDYLRLDASLTIEGNLKKKKPVHSSFIFSLYNVTGRDNPYSVYYKNEDGVLQSYMYSVITVPIFTASWLFKFGNYASE